MFLGAVHDSEEEWVSQWWVPLEVNSVPMKFKIDTGADVSVMPEEMFSQLKEVSLTPSTRTLHGPGSHTLAVRGKFTASLQYKNRKAEEEIYVIPGSSWVYRQYRSWSYCPESTMSKHALSKS